MCPVQNQQPQCFHPRCGHPRDWASSHYLPATGRCLSALSVAPRDSDNRLSLSAAHSAVHGVVVALLVSMSTCVPRPPVPRDLHQDQLGTGTGLGMCTVPRGQELAAAVSPPPQGFLCWGAGGRGQILPLPQFLLCEGNPRSRSGGPQSCSLPCSPSVSQGPAVPGGARQVCPLGGQDTTL